MKIVIITKKYEEGEKLYRSLARFNTLFSSVKLFTKDDVHNHLNDVRDCEFIFSTWYMPEFSESEIEQFFPKLKAVFYAAGTAKYFAEPYLKKGIRVFSAASANGIPVAEFTVSQIILAGKGYFQSQRAYKWPIWHRGFYKARNYSECKWGNYDAKIGIIGCGAIGSKVVELLKPYKLNIFVYDPFLSDNKVEELGVNRVSIEEIFQNCDVISNHLPDIKETKGMINYTLLNSMKSTATIINTGRGAQIDEVALNKVLRKNKNMCALLDVTTHEPLYPWSPLYWRKNVFLTPHIAGSMSQEFDRMVDYVVEAYNDFIEGKKNVCEISLEVLAKQSTH